jgi:hypothetical protein
LIQWFSDAFGLLDNEPGGHYFRPLSYRSQFAGNQHGIVELAIHCEALLELIETCDVPVRQGHDSLALGPFYRP